MSSTCGAGHKTQRGRVFGGRRRPGYPPTPMYATQTVASPRRVPAWIALARTFLFRRRHPSPGWRTTTRIHHHIRSHSPREHRGAQGGLRPRHSQDQIRAMASPPHRRKAVPSFRRQQSRFMGRTAHHASRPRGACICRMVHLGRAH
jgi:hypothetical protein